MITTLLIKIIQVLFVVLATLLPSWSIPDYLIIAFDAGLNNIAVLNGFLPVQAIFRCVVIIISLEIAILTTRLAMGGISIFRGGGKINIWLIA